MNSESARLGIWTGVSAGTSSGYGSFREVVLSVLPGREVPQDAPTTPGAVARVQTESLVP